MFLLALIIAYIKNQRPRVISIERSSRTIENIPLKNFQVDVDITGSVAQANYTLKYVNEENETLEEAKLKFPFDTDVTVSGVKLQYKNKTIYSEIMKKSEAKAVYENEKNEKNVAMLVQRIGDYISIDLAGIAPNETFIAQITTYVSLDLKFEHKKEYFFSRYCFPTSMVPRYTPSNREVEYENPELRSKVNYSFELNLRASDSRISPESVSSLKANSKGEITYNETTLTYKGDVPDDVVIDLIATNTKSDVMVTVEHFNNSTTTEVAFPASFLRSIRKDNVYDNKINRSYVFLIDRSGSMTGHPIREAKSALKLYLHSLPSNSRFDIVGFGSCFASLFNELVTYNDSTLEEADKYVSSIEANLGGTEILEPLKQIFPQRPDNLIILTDGAVSNVKELEEYCASFNTRISTIGIGSYADSNLLKSISRSTGGTYELIYDVEQIEGSVIRSLSAIQDGFLIKEVKSNCGILYQEFPTVLAKESDQILRFFSPNNVEDVVVELKVEDIIDGKEFEIKINKFSPNIIFNEINDSKKLHSIALLRAVNSHVIDDKEALNQSLRLGIMTPLTSFILVDERMKEDKEKLVIGSVKIPVKVHHGERYMLDTDVGVSTARAGFGGYNLFKLSTMNTPIPPILPMAPPPEIKAEAMAAPPEQMMKKTKTMDTNQRKESDKCNEISFLQKSKGNWILKEVLDAIGIKMSNEDYAEWKSNSKNELLGCLLAIRYLKNSCNEAFVLVINKGESFISSNYSKEMIDSALIVVDKYMK